MVLFRYQPKHDPQGQNGTGQSAQGSGRNLLRLENDQFSGQGHDSDQDDGPYLNDAFLPARHLDDGMPEFHRNQDGHDHAEKGLEGGLLKRLHPNQQYQPEDLLDQTEQSQRDDH